MRKIAIASVVSIEMSRIWMNTNPDLAINPIFGFVKEYSGKGMIVTSALLPTDNYLTLSARIAD
jgi:hypothetical protein